LAISTESTDGDSDFAGSPGAERPFSSRVIEESYTH